MEKNIADFSPEQSLKLIQAMIGKAKEDISDSSIHYLVWGWLTFFACIGQFILKNIFEYPKHYQVWGIIIIGIVFSIVYSIKQEGKSRVKTYIGDSIKYLWIGMAIAYFVLSMILSKTGWGTTVFPFFIMLYGLGTYVSGSIIRFRPLVTGGLLASLLAVLSAFVSYDYQMLVAAGAILISYIIPAYMLRAKKGPVNA